MECKVGEYLIEDLCRIPVEVEYASEFRYRNPIISEDDVVIAISQSGRTTTLINAIEQVKSRGAIVIAIAPSDTPVAMAATIPLTIDAKEDIQIYTPLSSRIAHLVVIDVLAIGVAKHKGGQLQEHLLDLQHGLEALRVPQND